MKTILSLILLLCATATTVAQPNVENRGFKAVMNGKIPVEVVIQTAYNKYDNNWMTAGYLYYPKAKNPAPILIVGDWGKEKPILPKEDNFYSIRLVEYQPNGEITGLLYVTYSEVEGDYEIRKASWKNPTTGRILQLSQIEEMRELPAWYPKTPAVLSAPPRKQWKCLYHVYNTDNEDSEWVNTLKVTFKADDKEMMTVHEDLVGAFTSAQEEILDWVTEEDINFDGIPDVKLFIGNSIHAQSMYKAYVWNPVTRQFYPVEEFDEIQEPEFDRKTKSIISRIRDVNCMYVETWKWQNGKLKKVATKKLLQH